MKIFITGATGFIGSFLIDRLIQTNHEIVCLVRKTSDITRLLNIPCTIVTGDVTDINSIRNGMKGCNAVVNLANIYSLWLHDKSLFHKVNVKGTQNVMECALEISALKVVHVSTATVYGKPSEVPFTEESKPGPIMFSEYAKSKYEGEKIAWEMQKKSGLPLIVLYPGVCLGPRDTKDSAKYMKLLIQRKIPIVAFKNSVLTYLHVKDVAESIVNVLDKTSINSGKYLIGNCPMSIHDFNKEICKISNTKPPEISLPSPLVFLIAHILTAIAKINKKPPPFSLAIDQARTMKHGFIFKGEKAINELKIVYTDVKSAIEEAITSFNL